MSAQSSNLPINTPQQSQTICSNTNLALSSYSRDHTLAATKDPSSPKKMAPRYFEEYGLCVPLVRLGQKRVHARSARELASKSKRGLLAIVKDYAANRFWKLRSASKSDIIQWIERVETLALGPHPKTQLASTKKEDLVEALGLKTTAAKAKVDGVKRDAQGKRSGQKKPTPPAEDKVVTRSIVSFSSKADKFQKAASVQQATPSSSSPPQQPVATRKRISHDIPIEATHVVQKANKRKYDNAEAPTDVEQTPAKKTRVIRTPSPKATDSPQMSITVCSDALFVEDVHHASTSTEEYASQDRETAVAITHPSGPTNILHPYEDVQNGTDFTPKKNKHPPTLIHQEDEDVVTHVSLETHKHVVDSTSTKTPTPETPNSSRSHTTSATRTTCCPPTPHNYPSTPSPSHPNPDPPFLKPGTHGRHGDFTSDPDRRTGRGHAVGPAHLRRKRAYETLHRAFYQRYPGFPFVRADGDVALADRLRELRRAEVWMRVYRDMYVGENVAHLWDCGCEVLVDGEVSEED